jgi:hypothetical protein
MKRFAFWCLLPLTLSSVSVQAAERREFGESGGPPVYMRLETTGEYGFEDGGLFCIPVYRNLAGIPEDFNLLEVLDPDRDRARAVELLVDGFVITHGGPPKLQHYENSSDKLMPILFVPTTDLQAAAADGEIYIDELCELVVAIGIADMYTEQVYTGWQHTIVITGVLLNGTSFIANYAHGAATVVPKVEANIIFGD